MDTVDVDEHGRVRGVAIHMPYEVHAMDDSNSFDAANTNAFDDTLPVARRLTQAPTMGQGGVAEPPDDPTSPHRLLYAKTEKRMGNSSSSASAATHPSGTTVTASVRSFLRTVPHLYTLTVEQIATLPVLVREYAEMSVIVEEGQMLEHVCVLASGTVEVMNSTRGPRRVFGHRRIGSITAPNIFGLEEVILDKPTSFTYHTSTTATLLLLRRAPFLQLFRVSPMFANSVSSHILYTLAPFSAFQDYCRLLFGLVHDSHAEGGGVGGVAGLAAIAPTNHRISLPLIIHTYINCGVLGHRYARSNRLDVDALQLCVRRLPANIGETHVLLLTHALPEYLANSFVGDAVAQRQGWLSPSTVAVDTGRRRRCAWRIGSGGQTLIVMRDGFTDPMDLVSNLAMFAVEAKKLQTHMEQLVSPSAMEILSVWLSRQQKQRRWSRRQQQRQRQRRHRSRPPAPARPDDRGGGEGHHSPERRREAAEGDAAHLNDSSNDDAARTSSPRTGRRRGSPAHPHTSEKERRRAHHSRSAAVARYPEEDCAALLEQLQFSPREAAGLRATWGDDRVARQLYNLLLHRQEYVVQLSPAGVHSFAHDVYASWSLTILRHLKSCLGIAEAEALPEDGVVIDVVFSPNRTVKNLFCSMRQEYCALIEEASQTLYAESSSGAGGGGEGRQGGQQHHCSGAATWRNDEDRSYYILTCLMERDAHVRAAYRARLERNGFALFEDAYPSALLVDCIDVGRLCVRDTDTGLQAAVASAQSRSRQSGVRHFVLNIDKTFGAQVESILRALLLSLGNRIRSVNLMGKAAGLMGQRGDVVVPSRLIFSKQSFGEDTTDEIRLANRNTLTVEDITPFLGQSCSAAVHQGACLTLPSFVLQSEPVLKFYKIVHGCVCEEMQSSYIARQLEECRRTGVLHKSIASRYLFYCNDMPLGNDDGSVIRSCKREIISTIYATARALLRKILES